MYQKAPLKPDHGAVKFLQDKSQTQAFRNQAHKFIRSKQTVDIANVVCLQQIFASDNLAPDNQSWVQLQRPLETNLSKLLTSRFFLAIIKIRWQLKSIIGAWVQK